MPFTDEWSMVGLFQKGDAHTLRLADFWAQHNEHRMFFPKLAMYGIAQATNWNIRLELGVLLALAFAVFLILFVWLRHTLAARPWALGFIGAVSISIWMFSPVQWENWLLGFQISWFMNMFMAVGAITALWAGGREGWIWPSFCVAVAVGLISEFSLASGIFIWPAALPIFFVRKGLRKLVLIWVAIGVAATIFYFHGWVRPQTHPPMAMFFEHPLNSVKYLLFYLGSPVADTKPNYVEGAILLAAYGGACLYLLFLKRTALDRAVVWMSLGIWSLLTAIATAVGRVGFGLQLAASSRYTTISILFIIATIGVLAAAILANDPATGTSVWQAACLGIAFTVLSGQFLADFNGESREMQAYAKERRQVKQCLDKANFSDQICLSGGLTDKQVMFQWTQYLKEKGWGGFDAPP